MGTQTGSTFNIVWDESHHTVSSPPSTPLWRNDAIQLEWLSCLHKGFTVFDRFPNPQYSGSSVGGIEQGSSVLLSLDVGDSTPAYQLCPSFWPCTLVGSQFWFSLMNKLEADWHVWYLVKQSLQLHPPPNYYIWFCQCKLRVNLVNKSFRCIVDSSVQLLLLVSAEGWSQIIQNRNKLGSFLLLVWKYLLISQFKWQVKHGL